MNKKVGLIQKYFSAKKKEEEFEDSYNGKKMQTLDEDEDKKQCDTDLRNTQQICVQTYQDQQNEHLIDRDKIKSDKVSKDGTMNPPMTKEMME